MKEKKKGATSICESWRKCLKCSAEYHVNPQKPHQWYHVTCRNCLEFSHVNDRCYIQPVHPQEDIPQDDFEEPNDFEDDENDEEKKGPPPKPILNFADIECALSDDNVFDPNLICWSSEEDDDIQSADNIDDFLKAIEDLTEVEGDERPRKVITFFHNMRGFEGNFILEALYAQGRAVEKPLTQGAKILYFESGNIIFEDSMSFYAMALDKCPSTFHLRVLHKGFFSTCL